MIRVIQGEEKWLEIVRKQTGISAKDASQVLGIWTTIADINLGSIHRDIHIYVNKPGIQKYGFPKGSCSCKAHHEITEARLCLSQGKPLQEAHKKGVEAEFRRAQNLNILDRYVVSEIRSSLGGGLVKDATQKALAYFRVKGERLRKKT